MNNYCVYKHIFPNGKVYIGQTCHKPEDRWRRGFGYFKQKFIFNAIKEYGWNNIQHQIISENLTKKEANWLEKYLILYYESSTGKPHKNPPEAFIFSQMGVRKKCLIIWL